MPLVVEDEAQTELFDIGSDNFEPDVSAPVFEEANLMIANNEEQQNNILLQGRQSLKSHFRSHAQMLGTKKAGKMRWAGMLLLFFFF